MLGAIRKIFVRNTRQDESSITTFSTGNIFDNPNFITEPAKIIKLLQQIMAAPPLCSISLNNSSKTFFTSIIDIQEENGLIILDKLSTNSDNKILLKNKELKLSTCVNRVQVCFKLKKISVENLPDSVHYKARFPEKIYYPQRRSSPRIATDSTFIHFQGTSKNTKTTIEGYIFDFSRNGICVNLYSDIINIVQGDKLTDCLINLSDDFTLSFNLSVRSIRKQNSVSQEQQVGGCFDNLSPQNQKQLDRFISALEREQIRKRKN
ncbi:MAG: flagellar brake protein [Methylobacter sp.]|nr:flagellar brake protein [Methylobacter sp.]